LRCILFWVYWLVSAAGAEQGIGSGGRIRLTGLSGVSVLLLLRVFRGGGLAVHSVVLGAIGAVVFASGSRSRSARASSLYTVVWFGVVR
jgi:hypothetical protein